MTELIISQVVNGLVLGFLYVLIAIGLSIIFGMLGVVNFAHGVYFALGAYFALTLRDSVGPWAIVLAPIGVGIIGMAIEMTLMRPLYGKEPLLGLFMTFGIALFIEEVIRTIWGAPCSSPSPCRGPARRSTSPSPAGSPSTCSATRTATTATSPGTWPPPSPAAWPPRAGLPSSTPGSASGRRSSAPRSSAPSSAAAPST